MVKKSKYISDKGHLKNEYISLYIDAHLLNRVKELPDEILRHVEDCILCKHNIIEGYDILKVTDSITTKDHPYFKMNLIKPKKRNLIFFRVAASFVFIISIGTIALYLIGKIPETSNKIVESVDKNYKQDSINQKISLVKKSEDKILKNKKSNVNHSKKEVSKTEPNNLIAENELIGEEYQVSPIFISMLGENTRSAFFEVKIPKDSTLFENTEPINFKWESNVKEEIKLIIFNNKDELIFESDVLNSNEFVLEKSLLPGAYIWKIESKNELYHLGLFFIKK